MIKGKDGSKIPKIVIERLPRYYRYFVWLEGQMEKVSSNRLGEILGSSASQVRLDLSYFGDFGQQGYGYNITKLKNELSGILGINQQSNFIIVGAGNIGRALIRYNSFFSAGFTLKGIFDIKTSLIGREINGIKIYDFKRIDGFIEEEKIEIGVIAVPKEAANDAAKKLIEGGIRGILNFAPIDLNLPQGFPFENIHLIDKMLALSFVIKHKD